MKALALLAALYAASPLAAQQPTLDEVQAYLSGGDYREARDAIARWWQLVDASSATADSEERALGLLLRARLTENPRDAERHYLSLVLDYPMSPLAPEALLRLGQQLLLRGDAERAAGYLERLVIDYPGSSPRLAGRLWQVRALRALGRRDDACIVARITLETAPADNADLLEREAAHVCPHTAVTTQPPAAAPADAPASSATFAVQSGAFRQRTGAEALAARLRSAGYEPRLVFVPNSSLLRVRVGRFERIEEAQAFARRLVQAGFAAVAVRDAARERAP